MTEDFKAGLLFGGAVSLFIAGLAVQIDRQFDAGKLECEKSLPRAEKCVAVWQPKKASYKQDNKEKSSE